MLSMPFTISDGRKLQRELTSDEVVRVAQLLSEHGLSAQEILDYFVSAGNMPHEVLSVLGRSTSLRVSA